MTMFDLIKYPLSDEPTQEELNAIPDEILKKWAHKVKHPLVFDIPPEVLVSTLRHEILIHNETRSECFLRHWNRFKKRLHL